MDVYSKKYGINGEIIVTDKCKSVKFQYTNKIIEIGIDKDVPMNRLIPVAKATIEEFIRYMESNRIVTESSEKPEMEENSILLILSNTNQYFFHSLYLKRSGALEKIECTACPNTGMFQDSFLIRSIDIDMRYFLNAATIEFYKVQTGKRRIFIENTGNISLIVKTPCGAMQIKPNQRKELTERNTEKIYTILPNGELYQARVMMYDIDCKY